MDRKYPQGFQFMPKELDLEKKVIMSRNRIPAYIVQWVNEANAGTNLEQYIAAVDDEALIPIIKLDAGTRGCIFLKREDRPDGRP